MCADTHLIVEGLIVTGLSCPLYIVILFRLFVSLRGTSTSDIISVISSRSLSLSLSHVHCVLCCPPDYLYMCIAGTLGGLSLSFTNKHQSAS